MVTKKKSDQGATLEEADDLEDLESSKKERGKHVERAEAPRRTSVTRTASTRLPSAEPVLWRLSQF